MNILIVAFIILLLVVIIVQIGKLTELSAKIKGEEEVQYSVNKSNGILSVVFLVVFLGLSIWSSLHYKNWFLGFGPNEAASEHGTSLDFMFKLTLFFTGVVFFITQILLFWFAYRYSGKRNSKAVFQPHDTKLELIWTAIPAVVMALLVMGGLDAWNEVMADVAADDEYMEIEATGMQFAWLLRYPGPDGKLGTRDFKTISSSNPLGQVWSDEKNLDDMHPTEIVLPKGKKVRVRITSRDVLHNFYLPQFRVKMDAVPGMPTYFVFTPTKTTEEYRRELSRYPEYNRPVDRKDPTGPKIWEVFDYELACAELCGNAHFSMRKTVRIVEEPEYLKWLATQQSYYLNSIRNTDEDQFKGNVLDVEIGQRKVEFDAALQSAISAAKPEEKIIRLKHINFETGSATLTSDSKYELDNVIAALQQYPQMTIELAGHTDNVGDPKANLTLSQARAGSVLNYLTEKGSIDKARLRAVGYGQGRPIDTNDTEDGRAKNRRTEFQILTQ
jgi:cytochrome c oxidase subunit 2